MAESAGVLRAKPIVQGDAAQVIRRDARQSRSTGRVNRSPSERTSLAGQRQGDHHLAEAVIVEIFRDHQVLREADMHAFVTLKGICSIERHDHISGSHAAGAAVDNVRRGNSGAVAIGAVDRGLVKALTGKAGHAHHLTNAHKVGAAGVDEDAVRSCRISIACEILQIESLQTRAAFKVANHHAPG